MQFEYKLVVKPNLLPEAELNALGAEEWELISFGPYGDFMAYYLKRVMAIEVLEKTASTPFEIESLQKSFSEHDDPDATPVYN